MPLVLADRVNETTTTTSTGTITLAGAVSGYQSFAVIGNGNTTYYTIVHQTANEWEVGIGTYTSSGTTLARNTVLASSNSGSLVNFSAGTKFVFCDYPAGRAVYLDTATNVTIPGLTLSGGTANGVLYLNGSKVATSGSALVFDGTSLTFGSTAQRITADMSNGTVSNRFAFQNSVTNAQSIVSILPNGTGTVSQLQLFNNSTPTNAPFAGLFAGASDARIVSGVQGSGSYLPLTFYTNGSEQMRLDTSGNVGIGTASPGAKLDVNGTIYSRTGGVYTDTLTAYSGSSLSVNAGSSNFNVVVNGSERMRLDSAGRFLLGASSNTSRGGANTTALFYKASGTQYLDIQTGTSGDSGIVFSATSSSAYGLINYSNSVNAMLFYANSAEVFRITSSGLLGLGTTTPAAELHVVNSTPNSGRPTALFDANYGNTGDTVTGLRLNVNAGAGGGYQWGYSTESVLAHNMEFISGSNYVARSTSASNLQQTGGSFIFFSNQSLTAGSTFTPTERMRLDTSGNLGIGTASPTSKLQVAGAVAASIDGSGVSYYYPGGGAIRGSSAGDLFIDTAVSGGTDIIFRPAVTERMRLTTSGNLGIGTASPGYRLHVAQASGNDIGFFGTSAGGGGRIVFSDGNSGTAASVPRIGANGNDLLFYTNTSGSNATERARITAAGDLLVGTTSPAYSTAGRGLIELNGSSDSLLALKRNNTSNFYIHNYTQGIDVWNTANTFIRFATNATERLRIDSLGDMVLGAASVARVGSDRTFYIEGSAFASLNLACGGAYSGAGLTVNSSAALLIRNTGAERARIDSSGRVIINGTTQLYSSTLTLYRTGNSYNLTSTLTGTGNEGHVVFENGNGAVGTIFTNGTATAYNTSSDYRLKNTIAPMTGALAKVALLKPCTYKWNADGSDGQGFIAHELAEVVPQCVTGEKDAVDAEGKPRYQGVDTSFLVATLTAAIQELTARVAQLENK